MAVRVMLVAVLLLCGPARGFDFKDELFEAPTSLSVWIVSQNWGLGSVDINGVDVQGPSIPFTFDWGDGQTTESFFPVSHVYTDNMRNYRLTVTAHYGGGATDSTQIPVLFTLQSVNAVALPVDLRVEIPDHVVTLGTHYNDYAAPTGLDYFDGFTLYYSRGVLEYILSVGAKIQMDCANGNVLRPDGTFRQLVLRDPGFGGMYTLWFTTPVSLAASNDSLENNPEFSSLFHEMGHNVTLNFPAGFHYGGRIDGCANAIFSETLAQIFQHATAYEILNRRTEFGMDETLACAIELSARDSMRWVRWSHDQYVEGGKAFHSWVDPEALSDPTFFTFMTVAFQFFVHAEQEGDGYVKPVRRMMRLLGQFDADRAQRYDQDHDTPEAATFRSTLMVAGVSNAFGDDLRAEFRDLNFPIDDATFEALIAKANVRGDIDASGFTNALDVQLVINGALGLDVGWYEPDQNGDETVNAMDVQRVINAALGLS